MFPKLSPPPRLVCALRRAFRRLDTATEGRVDTDDLEYALARCHVKLEKKQAARLSEALDLDGSATTAYEDVMEFFETLQLPWYKVVDDIAGKVAKRVFGDQASRHGWKAFATLRGRLCAKDKAGTGEIPAKPFREVMNSADVGLLTEEIERLVEALEVVDSEDKDEQSRVRYRELLRHLLSTQSDTLEEVLVEFVKDVRKQLSQLDGGVKEGLQRILAESIEADGDKTGTDLPHDSVLARGTELP
jgi:Ca2+-binding EF-hand superfamily protein